MSFSFHHQFRYCQRTLLLSSPPHQPTAHYTLTPWRLAHGDERARTADPLLARQVLSQLSYAPTLTRMGLPGLEPGTSRLSGVRSHQLSYRPNFPLLLPLSRETDLLAAHNFALPRKEVIQPQVLLRLPCYDFTPIALHTFGACPLTVGPATSGVYKARERIHRDMLIRDY